MIQKCKPEKVHSEKIYDEIRQKSMILLSLPISSSIPKQALLVAYLVPVFQDGKDCIPLHCACSY